MSCTVIDPDNGEISLTMDPIGELVLNKASKYCVVELQVGWASERAVMRNRALSDGTIDNTQFLGNRAITLTVRLDNMSSDSYPTQKLIDQLLPYMTPRRRPLLKWKLPDSVAPAITQPWRAVRVRGTDAPVVINGPKYTSVVLSFVTEGSYLSNPETSCFDFSPGTPVPEVGRTYNLTFNREYEPTLPVNGFYVTNNGNAPAQWSAVIAGPVVDPEITFWNSPASLGWATPITMSFASNGGLTLLPGQSVWIDTYARTVLLNNDSAFPVYDRVNFQEWTWDDWLLEPGDSIFRIDGIGFSALSSIQVCTTDTYY